jgi:hypothetical protein
LELAPPLRLGVMDAYEHDYRINRPEKKFLVAEREEELFSLHEQR